MYGTCRSTARPIWSMCTSTTWMRSACWFGKCTGGPSTIRRSSRKEPPLVRPILIPPGSVVSTLGDGWFSETKYFLELTEQAWHRKRLGQIEDVGSALGTEQCDTFSVSGHENRFHDRTLFP